MKDVCVVILADHNFTPARQVRLLGVLRIAKRLGADVRCDHLAATTQDAPMVEDVEGCIIPAAPFPTGGTAPPGNIVVR